MSAQYIAIDTETGGVDRDKHSLLTACFDVLDNNLCELDSLHLKIRDDPYCIDPEAMTINKIDLLAHDKIAIHKSDAGSKLRDYLRKHSDEGAIKLVPIGHGISFDLLWIHDRLLNRKVFETYTSYRKIDTSMIAQFFKLVGVLPEDVSGSVGSLCLHFGIPTGELHDARSDNIATVAILRVMKQMMGSRDDLLRLLSEHRQQYADKCLELVALRLKLKEIA